MIESIIIGILALLCLIGVSIMPRRGFAGFNRLLFFTPFILFIILWILSGFLYAIITFILVIILNTIISRFLPAPKDVKEMMLELKNLKLQSSLDSSDPPQLRLSGECKFEKSRIIADLLASFYSVNNVPREEQNIKGGANRFVVKSQKQSRFEYRIVYRVADDKYLYIKSNSLSSDKDLFN